MHVQNIAPYPRWLHLHINHMLRPLHVQRRHMLGAQRSWQCSHRQMQPLAVKHQRLQQQWNLSWQSLQRRRVAMPPGLCGTQKKMVMLLPNALHLILRLCTIRGEANNVHRVVPHMPWLSRHRQLAQHLQPLGKRVLMRWQVQHLT